MNLGNADPLSSKDNAEPALHLLYGKLKLITRNGYEEVKKTDLFQRFKPIKKNNKRNPLRVLRSKLYGRYGKLFWHFVYPPLFNCMNN